MTETSIQPLELRRAGTDGHVLTGLVVPYGRVSMRTEHRNGERFMPGAFASASDVVKQIRLTDSHQPGEDRRPVGVATELRETADGLVGTFRFYDTPEGRGAYENVTEETYGGLSIGFRPVRERVGDDGVREVHEAQLFHVSLVDEPAYDDARVLAVRAAEEAAEQQQAAEQAAADKRAAAAARERAAELASLVDRTWTLADFHNSVDPVTLGIEYGTTR